MKSTHITIYSGARNPIPAACDDFVDWSELSATFDDLVQRTSSAPATATAEEQKKSLLAFSPHRLIEGSRRALENVQYVSLLVLDLDRCEVTDVVENLSELSFRSYVYASPSDPGPGDAPRRVRVVCPISRSITVEECPHMRFALAELLGLKPGCGVEGCIDAAKIFFVGRLHGTPERETWQTDGTPVDVDVLAAWELEHKWGAAQASAVLAPALTELPPANAGIVTSLGDWTLHDGRKHAMCGAIGGVMRKANMTREACAAVVREWLPSGDADVDVGAGVAWACKAWDVDADAVSGTAALAAVVGAEHAAVIDEAVLCAAYPHMSPKRTAERRKLRAKPAIDESKTPWAVAPAADGEYSAQLVLDCTRQGVPRPHHNNIMLALEVWFGNRIRFEEMRGRIVCSDVDRSMGYFPDGPWTDIHTTSLVTLCERNRLYVSHNAVDKAVALHAHERKFNALTDWLLEAAANWDGTPRVDSALATYWGAEDCAATTVTSRVFLLSLAARGLEPGCKMDTCTIFVGNQGTRKSSALRALAGNDWFADSPLAVGDKDGMQTLRGKWLWEFQENGSFGRRERNIVKGFLSSQVDTFRASYGRHTDDVVRQTCFVVSTNDDDVLDDPTGDRRFLPVRIGTRLDTRGIEAVREQLLGEAAHRVLHGEAHWPSEADNATLAPVREAHREVDAWETLIADWLDRRESKGRGAFALVDIFSEVGGAIPMVPAQIDRRAQMRAAAALKRLGMKNVKCARGELRNRHVWERAGDAKTPSCGDSQQHLS